MDMCDAGDTQQMCDAAHMDSETAGTIAMQPKNVEYFTVFEQLAALQMETN